ncbi:MAG: SAM-dependent methyltransferase, partial [Eubacteriales bacterium]|nr:SAM-dependent methyltransferase [Eubacteriales bacterium]
EFCLVHRPSRLVDIIFYCRKYRLEPKEICFVHPRQGRSANIVLLRCVKNGGPELRFLDPLYVYESDGEYTNEIKKIYQKET